MREGRLHQTLAAVKGPESCRQMVAVQKGLRTCSIVEKSLAQLDVALYSQSAMKILAAARGDEITGVEHRRPDSALAFG